MVELLVTVYSLELLLIQLCHWAVGSQLADAERQNSTLLLDLHWNLEHFTPKAFLTMTGFFI